MRLILTLSFAFLASSMSHASEIKCQVQEINGDKNVSQDYSLTESEDPHGAFIAITLSQFPDHSGFLALSKGVIVIHIYDSKTGSAFTTQSAGQKNRYARLQVILGGSEFTQAIVIDCLEQSNDGTSDVK